MPLLAVLPGFLVRLLRRLLRLLLLMAVPERLPRQHPLLLPPVVGPKDSTPTRRRSSPRRVGRILLAS